MQTLSVWNQALQLGQEHRVADDNNNIINNNNNSNQEAAAGGAQGPTQEQGGRPQLQQGSTAGGYYMLARLRGLYGALHHFLGAFFSSGGAGYAGDGRSYQ